VICAALWPDPADENCPVAFREGAAELITAFAKKAVTTRDLSEHCSPESWQKWQVLAKPENALDIENPVHVNILRYRLLDFIADFANWDNSTQKDYLETSRKLTQLAHEALGGVPGTRPLVVDPFAGGGAIPLEALRVGADAFASDLNPVAVLLNKVVLEYIPKYGQKLADEVRKCGQWVKDEAEKELAEFYPKDEDGSTPIAYLWARTIISEAPDDGTGIPVEVPLMRSLWLAKKKGRNRALRWVRDEKGKVKTETDEITYADGVTRKVRRPLLEIFEPKNAKEVEGGTVARGSATCPVTGYTTPVASVRTQIKPRKGGADDARLFCVVTTKQKQQGRFYRLPTERDWDAVRKAAAELERRKKEHQGELSLVPDETLPVMSGVFNAPIYGHNTWGTLFTPRQALALTTLAMLVRKAAETAVDGKNKGLSNAVETVLDLALDKQVDSNSSLCAWRSTSQNIGHTFGRQALPMLWDFVEASVISGATRDWLNAVEGCLKSINSVDENIREGQTEQANAAAHPLPDDAAQFFCSDPPYYNAVPYSDLSDFFYVWLKRTLGKIQPSLFETEVSPKDDEICEMAGWDSVRYPHKNSKWFEERMKTAMAEGCRVLSPDGIGVIVFAHKSTAGWEAQLQAMVDAGWTITGSWPIDTEMGTRLRAKDSAALASSVHLVCRPRENPAGTLKQLIGDWRDVLQEFPQRIHKWMPHLASEGVVGADAIFACLGPALEVFSRYSSVEKASGEQVTLREYLEYVWAAVSKEALSMIFQDADATGLEEDARLTAMWLWTLSTGCEAEGAGAPAEEDDQEDDDDEKATSSKAGGFTLEYDTARKIAQGLGANLETLRTIVEIKGNKARLLPVQERSPYLMGKGETPTPTKRKKKGQEQLLLPGILPEVPEEETIEGAIQTETIGKTALDRIHQSMLLFASGRSEALKRFLVDDGVGQEDRFWKLAQSLSALYPSHTDEKRWVDGVLARKKGLRF
jgi:adenine-specific DNA methylase